MSGITRRDTLKLAAAPLLGSLLPATAFAQSPAAPARKPVAGVITVYFPGSHADVILGKIMEGWEQAGGAGPALKLVSLYVDQFPDDDLARAMCKKHGVILCDSIEQALTLGGNSVAVEGVICIGEHGDYPYNELGQHLYPRRRLFSEIATAFEKHGRVVPVFHDKHLGPQWNDAIWMYERAQQLQIPFLAGSSMPVGYRIHEISVPLHSEIQSAVGIGYDGLDIYGFHALELYQYYVERRPGGERGVRRVQFLSGPEMWQAVDDGRVHRPSFDAAFQLVPKKGTPNPREDAQAGLFLFEYVDGFQGALFMLTCVEGTAVGLQLKGATAPIATAFDERTEPRYPHFAYLLKAIERMIFTGKPTYPVERTLLTAGILDRALTSRHRGNISLETPELAIAYQPVAYPHAPHVDLLTNPAR